VGSFWHTIRSFVAALKCLTESCTVPTSEGDMVRVGQPTPNRMQKRKISFIIFFLVRLG